MEKKLLTVNQLAKACATSRSTLLRMEEAGILNPVFINPESGYRYYDESSVIRVNKNLSLQELGITHKELKEYYANSEDYTQLLHKMQVKMAAMEYHIANMKLQLRQNENLSVSDYSLPPISCVRKTLPNVKDLSSIRLQLVDAFKEVVQMGYTIDRQMCPFIRVDYKKIKSSNYQNNGDDFDICIPVIPNSDSRNVEQYSATDSISAIMYGGSGDILKAFENIDATIKSQNLSIRGLAIIVPIVRSFPGVNIPEEYWVTRVCVPISRN